MKSAIALGLLGSVAAAQTGKFTALSFNVAGLPAFLNDNGVPGDKETNTGIIGSKFTQYSYDIIHVQEDFNYHAKLYETDNHPQRTATSGGVPFGSGLNTLSNFPWTGLARVKWTDCQGTISDSNDCLTPKGYSYMRIQVAPGVEIDVYNLHADAGSSDKDFAARRSNINQVVAAIGALSAGYPVLVFGDTNSRYTNANDAIRNFTTVNGLTDPWVELVKGGVAPVLGSTAIPCDNPAKTQDCEIVDKLFYRSGNTVELKATAFRYVSDMFLQPDGNLLSDHNPILTNFTYTVKSAAKTDEGTARLLQAGKS